MKQSERHLNFRETLRKLLNTNENVFGKQMTMDDSIDLINSHQRQETNELGRRVMRQRRVKIPTTTRSSYNAFFKNHPETTPHKIKPKLSMNLELEHRKNPLRAVSSLTTENSLYKKEFDNKGE